MKEDLEGKRVAILVADGFEQIELMSARLALESAGARTDIVSPSNREVRSWKGSEWGRDFPVDVPLDEAQPGSYDALVLPGGVMNPDKLRRNQKAVAFVKSFFAAGKPVAAMCYGLRTLVDAGVLSGRHVASYESIQRDLKNAGAEWSDEEVVVDNGLITTRESNDTRSFNRTMVEQFATDSP